MSMTEDLIDYLNADATVDGFADSAIYDRTAPASSGKTRIIVNRISGVHVSHMASAAGIVDALYQVDCFSDSPDTAEDMANAVRDALDGYRGTMGSTDVRDVDLQSDADEYEPPTDASEFGLFRVRFEFRVWHAESVPTF